MFALVLVSPALTGGARLAAQAVERTDIPGRGVVRVTFDPRIVTWDAQFVDGARLRLGAPLTGDTVGSAAGPTLARLEQDMRTASRVPGVVLSLGAGIFSVRQEQRTTPVTAEVGLTERLAVSVMVPIVRVATRTRLQLSGRGANLGLNPLFRVTGAAAAYGNFFTQFDTTLERFDLNIDAGMYGCPPDPPGGPCAARDSSAVWHAVRDALFRSVHGTGSPFMPLDTSDVGRAIDTAVTRIQQALLTTYIVPGFTNSFLLATDTLSADLVAATILDSTYGFGYNAPAFRNSFRYALGDIEVAAKYRLAAGPHYAAAVVALARLPTAYRDSADDFLRQSIGDHQTDLEGRLVQELIVGGRLWLNLAVRAGRQWPGTRVRRVAPSHALLVPAAATAGLAWDPGDYLGVDVAPLIRFARQFAVGVTAGYWTKQRDRYSFRSAEDSSALATRLGVPTAASILDHGTAERRLRFGVAITYVAPHVEGGLSVEQTVSGSGVTPAATVYRIVLRTSRRFF